MPSLKILFLCKKFFKLEENFQPPLLIKMFCGTHRYNMTAELQVCWMIPIYSKALHESKLLRNHWSLFLRLPELAVWTQSLPKVQWNKISSPIAIFIPRHQMEQQSLILQGITAAFFIMSSLYLSLAYIYLALNSVYLLFKCALWLFLPGKN